MEVFWFRNLYHALLNVHEVRPACEVLQQYLPESRTAVDSLARYGAPEAASWAWSHLAGPDQPVVIDEFWNLYALSRISDVLLLPYQPVTPDGNWIPAITSEARTEFWLSLGMIPVQQTHFHPFYHEIVAVEPSARPGDPITLLDEVWPGFMLGNMMFCRAGVRVAGGTDHIVRDIAEHSTLYFAYWRRNRRPSDLSHDWGHNSQWRTRFHRNYAVDGTYFFNVDGAWDVVNGVWRPGLESPDEWPPPAGDLPVAARIELLRHRCLVYTAWDDADLWPWDDYYVELPGQST